MKDNLKLSYNSDPINSARLGQELATLVYLYLEHCLSEDKNLSTTTDEILSMNLKSALICVILSHKTEVLVSDIDDFLETYHLQVEHTALNYQSAYYRFQCELGITDSNKNIEKMIETLMLHDLLITLHPLSTSEVVKIAPSDYRTRLVSFLCKE